MSDEQDQWEAVAALLSASPLGDDVYDYGRVPGENDNADPIPDAFVVLSVERRAVATNRSGGTDIMGWRVAIRYVGTTAANARTVGGWVRASLETTPGRGKKLTVDGVTSTPITHESTTAVDKDGDRFSGLSQWTFAL